MERKTRFLAVPAVVIVVWAIYLFVKATRNGGVAGWVIGIAMLIAAALLIRAACRQPTGVQEGNSQIPESGQPEDGEGRS